LALRELAGRSWFEIMQLDAARGRPSQKKEALEPLSRWLGIDEKNPLRDAIQPTRTIDTL
jgi:hypothetical protein